MTIIKLVMSIAADLRSKNYTQLVQDFVALIQLLASAEVPTPKAPILAAHLPQAAPGNVNADALAEAFEQFAAAHPEHAGTQGAAANLDWGRLMTLLVKLLPIILGGL